MRGYDEFLAGIFDLIGPALVALILSAVAVLAGLLWYAYPIWLKALRPRWTRRQRTKRKWPKWKWPTWKWPQWKWPQWKRRPRKKKEPKPTALQPENQIRTPTPEPEYLSAADRLANEGRYAEAIRERLRDSVSTLTRHGVVAPAPAWTANEVATTASTNRPAVSTPLSGATDIFSEVWYGHRPAGPDQDALMRRLTAEVKAALETDR